MNDIKVSVIIPVYNTEKYLRQCLDSVLNQTLKEIEVICVDDGSTDGSVELLYQYTSNDPRFILLINEENKGTSQARKDAVIASHGKYIMFMDGDDFLSPDACEKAYLAIQNSKTDILQFGVNIVNCAAVSEKRIDMNRKLVKPFTETVINADIISLCWEEKKFGFSLWNKIYSGDICRKAFLYVEDGFFPKAQDLYAFFIIAFFSNSTAGIQDQLYNYNFGIGITGGDIIQIDNFKTLLTEHRVYNALNRFVAEQKMQDKYKKILQNIDHSFLNECVNKWENCLVPECISDGFHALIETWNFEYILSILAGKKWENNCDIASKLSTIDYFQCQNKTKSKDKLTIVAYYQNIKNGGAQRVVVNLCNTWSKMTNEKTGKNLYRVILVTDEGPLEDEYPLNPNIIRFYLPSHTTHTREKYRDRFNAWNALLDKYDVDIVVDSLWVSPCTFWDMLSVKGHPSHPAFCIHTHSFFAFPFSNENSRSEQMMYIYRLCDGVVTLSECDQSYVSSFCTNTRTIINPLPALQPAFSRIEQDETCLIWVGRISAEKQPLDAIQMMKYLVEKCPKIKLYMVGGGDEVLTQKLKSKIELDNLQNNIILTGFTTDVLQYYKKCAIYIGTSMYEGFSLTMCESLTYGIPVVTYDLPWLTLIRDGRGIVVVDQGRPDLLAKEVLNLLNDPCRLNSLSVAGKQQMEELSRVDIGKEWKSFFDSIGEKRPYQALQTEQIVYQYITIFQQKAREKFQKRIAQKNRQINKLQDENKKLKNDIKKQKSANKKLKNELKAVKTSRSFKIGRFITWLPRKIRDAFRR